jgi:hypothetical protein
MEETVPVVWEGEFGTAVLTLTVPDGIEFGNKYLSFRASALSGNKQGNTTVTPL